MIRSAFPLSLDQLQRHAPSVFAQEAHESRSDRYAFIPTSAVLAGMKAEGFDVFAAGQSRTRLAGKRDFTRHVLRLRHQSFTGRNVKVGDSIPEIVLTNSHDGSSGYQLSAGFFRLVCSNGMVVGNQQSTIKVRHTGNVMGDVIEGATRVLDDLQIGMSRIEEFQGIQLQQPEQLALASAALQLRWKEGEAPVEAHKLLTPRRWDDRGSDLWTTFNRVQESLIKGGVKGRNANGGRMSTRAVTSVNEDIRLNKSLWTLADTMASLKLDQSTDAFIAQHEASFA
jgi:hypothetical protein